MTHVFSSCVSGAQPTEKLKTDHILTLGKVKNCLNFSNGIEVKLRSDESDVSELVTPRILGHTKKSQWSLYCISLVIPL